MLSHSHLRPEMHFGTSVFLVLIGISHTLHDVGIVWSHFPSKVRGFLTAAAKEVADTLTGASADISPTLVLLLLVLGLGAVLVLWAYHRFRASMAEELAKRDKKLRKKLKKLRDGLKPTPPPTEK